MVSSGNCATSPRRWMNTMIGRTSHRLTRADEPKLKRLRIDAGLTQRQLAEAAGVNIRQVQKIEAGEIQIGNVTLQNAARLASALGIEIRDLLN